MVLGHVPDLAVLLGISAEHHLVGRQNTWVDFSSMAVAIIGVSVPLFVIGPFLMLVFAMWLKWRLPTSGWFMAPTRAGRRSSCPLR
jgi:oligopeptide transport system permease protein